MRILHHGAVNGVTGSCHQLYMNDSNSVLIDCGLFQGSEAAGYTGPIYATEASAALLPLVIEDALKVGVTRDHKLIQACLSLLNNQLIPEPYQK